MESYSQSQPFNSTRNLAMWAMMLLGFIAILDVVNIVTNAAELILASQYPDTVTASLSDESADFTEMPGGLLQTAIGLIALGVGGFSVLGYLATIILFLIWMRRSYLNLKPLGIRNTEYSSGWAIGCWFVPFVNLARPYGIIKEIWTRSDPDDVEMEGVPLGSTLELTKIAAPMLGVWWAFWIISNVFNNISTRLTLGAADLDQHILSFWLSITSSVLTLVAALLAINVVNSITKRQEGRHKRIVGASQTPFPNYNAPPMPPTYSSSNWG